MFTAALTLLTGIIFGLAPAIQASAVDTAESLKAGGRSSAAVRNRRFRSFLVCSEVALAVVLLIGARLLIESLWRLMGVNAGFTTDRLLSMRMQLPDSRYMDGGKVATLLRRVQERVDALPGVELAGAVTVLPLSGGAWSLEFAIEGRQAEVGAREMPAAQWRAISSDYFRTMGIPLLSGRDFNERDRQDSPRVVIINEALVRRFWPGDANPIGKRLTIQGEGGIWREIVAVVGEVRDFGLDDEPKAEMYVPYAQSSRRNFTLVVRTASADPLSLSAAVTREIWAVDKDQPITDIKSMEQVLGESLAPRRFVMLLLGAFAIVALVLAAIGIYGVMSYSVTQRTHEIGVRMALGAQQMDVLREIVAEGLGLTAGGVVLGLAAAFLLTRVISSLFYQVSAADPRIYASAALLLAATALLACYLPARRAAQVDPMIALRHE